MEENKWIHFLQKHWFKGVLSLLTLSMVLVWGERLFGKRHTGQRDDYLVIERIAQRYNQGEPIELESLLSAEGIVNKHPEIRPSYETMLAQLFFVQSEKEKGVKYAKRTLERNAKELPAPYLAFGRASLQIAKGDLDGALESSLRLEAAEGSYLEAFNLLRICVLGEDHWNQLRQHPHYDAIAPLFKEGAVSLEDYLASF